MAANSVTSYWVETRSNYPPLFLSTTTPGLLATGGIECFGKMEQRAAIPPGLPRDEPTASYWQSPPDEIADLKTTETMPESADVVIVGSGISGANIAYNLLSAKPDTKIVMLEARQAASGASGRNGGHTKHASYRPFMTNVETVGLEDAVKIARLEYNCMTAVHKFIKQNNIDCDSRPCDTVDIFLDQAQHAQALKSVKLMQEHLGKDDPASRYIFHDPEETASKFATPNTYGSLQYEAGSLNAYRLTIGILKLALSKGLNLQCNTPVKSISSSTSSSSSAVLWTVATSVGRIVTPTLILATNGYTPHILPSLQGTILPFRGIVTAHRPGSLMPQSGLETTYSFIYAEGYEYMISIPGDSNLSHPGDIIIGGGLTKTQKAGPDGIPEYGNTDDTTIDHDIEAYLTNTTKDFFAENWGEDHPDGRIRKTWSGVMGYSADGSPFIGKVPGQDGLWLDVSFQGHGMVLCFLCAQAVAQMILGKDTEELDSWFPKCYRITEERMKLKFTDRAEGKQMEKGRAVEGDGQAKKVSVSVTT